MDEQFVKSAGRDSYSWAHVHASHSQEGLVNGADIPLALSKCDGAPPGLFRLALLPVKKRFRGLARCRQLVGRCARFPKRASFATKHSMVPVDDRPEHRLLPAVMARERRFVELRGYRSWPSNNICSSVAVLAELSWG